MKNEDSCVCGIVHYRNGNQREFSCALCQRDNMEEVTKKISAQDRAYTGIFRFSEIEKIELYNN